MGGKHYAIVVGINPYYNSYIHNLNYAERDALELYGAMCRAGFTQVDLITRFSRRLEDDQVRVGSLVQYIDETIPNQRRNPEDIIWFFFAGHGKRTQDPNNQDRWEDYLLPYDAGLSPGQTWIQVRWIVEKLKETGSKNIILCLDACRQSNGRSIGEEALQGNYEGVITLFACDKRQESFEIEHPDIRHGAFTYALLEAINQKACYPTIRELSEYLSRRVPEICRKYEKPEQTPVFQVEGDLQWQVPALPNVELAADAVDLTVLVQQARSAENAAFDLLQDKYDVEKLEIAKQKWWTVLESDPTHAEAREEIEKIIKRITRRELDQLPGKEAQPQVYGDLNLVINAQVADLSGQPSIPLEVVSRAVEPPPAPPKPKPQPKPQPPDPFSGWSLREWTFETVRVDRRGEIVERLSKTAKSHFVDLGEGVQLELVAIPGGEFQMGSPKEEEKRDSDEGPVRTVTVPPLLVSRYPVTVEQWRRVAGSFPAVLNPKLKADPSQWKDAKGPVEQVNWFDAMEFCARLSKATNRLYRLPTEAEWEYACRGGTQTPFAFGETLTPELANYDGNYTYADGSKGEYRQHTTSVGQFPPNGFGLQDMHGNVWEWCLDDWYDSYENAPSTSEARFRNDNHSHAFNSAIKLNNYQERFFQEMVKVNNEQPKLLRGGSWFSNPRICRSANRRWWGADSIGRNLGFRVFVWP
ncbi:MAG: hypothetical protein BJG00_009490 [Limnothrix sp. CACIAM 69d]|nr:MAG: hypothetical protein BJG00_009490 [Limnothrix sp. CACIAM 69d]